MKYLDRESQLNTMVHPVHTLKISDFDNDLIAQDPSLPPEDLEGFQEQGGYSREQIGDPSLPEIDEKTTVEGTLDRRKRISNGAYKGKNKKPKTEIPSDADIQTQGNMRGQAKPEDIFGEDYEGGPTYLRQLLQIGGAAGSMIPFMGGNMLKYLFGPRALAGAPYSLNPQRIMLPNGRMEYAPINLRSDEQKANQHMMIYGGKWNKPIR